ncbi:MAG: phosphate transport system regulatory protein PhoU [Planctomycetota bacterium]|nr:MAG: phosphate transport system regulatory protein PhoU [Planctomycetota bacterium]
MTKHFLRDLSEFTERLLRLTASVEDSIAGAINAVLSRDAGLAREVVSGDAEIDHMEVRLEEEALKILALHAPVARDLRYLVAAIKINNDLERMADVAASVAKRAAFLAEAAPVPPPQGIEDMAGRVRQMVRQAIQALVERESALARSVLSEDDAVDDLNRRILDEVEGRLARAGKEEVGPLLRWFEVARSLERIADLATNVSEDVIYLTEGEIVRHQAP